MSKLHISMRVALGAVAVAATVGGALTATSTSAWSTTTQPYGGCVEAWQAPQSPGANDCRADGWEVHPNLVIDNRDRVHYLTVHECRFEDGSGQRPRCVWFGDDMGNGHGLSYVEHNRNFHYFWVQDPTNRRWHWVTSSLADALAEGSTDGATTRDWSRCVERNHAAVVRCADGTVERS